MDVPESFESLSFDQVIDLLDGLVGAEVGVGTTAPNSSETSSQLFVKGLLTEGTQDWVLISPREGRSASYDVGAGAGLLLIEGDFQRGEIVAEGFLLIELHDLQVMIAWDRASPSGCRVSGRSRPCPSSPPRRVDEACKQDCREDARALAQAVALVRLVDLRLPDPRHEVHGDDDIGTHQDRQSPHRSMLPDSTITSRPQKRTVRFLGVCLATNGVPVRCLGIRLALTFAVLALAAGGLPAAEGGTRAPCQRAGSKTLAASPRAASTRSTAKCSAVSTASANRAL